MYTAAAPVERSSALDPGSRSASPVRTDICWINFTFQLFQNWISLKKSRPVLRERENERLRIRVPSVRHRDQVLVVKSLAGDVATKLHVVLLRVHVACVEENRQAKRLQRVQMLSPRVVIELQSKWQGMIVGEIQDLGGGVRHICEASDRVTSRTRLLLSPVLPYHAVRKTFCWNSPWCPRTPGFCQPFCLRCRYCKINGIVIASIRFHRLISQI